MLNTSLYKNLAIADMAVQYCAMRFLTVSASLRTHLFYGSYHSQRANRYIMVFHIVILYDIYLSGGGGQATLRNAQIPLHLSCSKPA